MKFAKEYQRHMTGMEEELPALGLKRLKEMIKKCQATPCSPQRLGDEGAVIVAGASRCSGSGASHCYVCDESFFPSLANELSAIVRCFNQRAKRLLKLHLASTGFRRYFTCFTNRSGRSHEALIRKGRDLVTYAILNAVAMRKISKKYDKKCYSKEGQAFRTEARKLQIEILESPWLHELMAFYINLRRSDSVAMELLGELSLTFDDEDKPTLSCGLLDSLRIDIDLTCSICLDTVFDAVSLSCGHIFCYLCSCAAASVTVVDGLESASPRSKCPLCRRTGVFPDAVRLNQLNILLRNSCPEYWRQRTRIERAERVRLAKEHWDAQLRAFTGI